MSEQEEPGGNRKTKEGIGMKTIKTGGNMREQEGIEWNRRK